MNDLSGGSHRFPVRVYYEDTDFSGVVYYANYLKFCERGRTELLRDLGIHHSELHARAPGDRLAFVVRRIEGDFLRPATIDDLLTVETDVTEIRGASIRMAQRILRGEEVLFRLAVQIAVIDGDLRPARIPADMRLALDAANLNGNRG